MTNATHTKTWHTFKIMQISRFLYNSKFSVNGLHYLSNILWFYRTAKLLKKGIEGMEYLVYKIDERNLLTICRQMWYELGNIYREMMDIKYEQDVLKRNDISKSGSKKINEYSKASILYYLKFINSFDSYVKYILFDRY